MTPVLLLVSFLHFICFGIGVELTVTPSPVTEGKSLTLTCSVTVNTSVYASFNPEIGSAIGLVQLSGGQCIDGTGQTCTQQCSCTTDGKSFSWILSGVNKTWDKTRVRCQVNNPTATNSDFISVSVAYPPTGALMITPSGTQSVLKGTPVTLQCQVRGGNPLATLTWQCKGSTVVGQDLTNDTTAVSSLTFTVDITYHQQQCVCTAGHQASPDGQFGTASVTFDVLYPPTGTLMITPSGTQTVLTGTPVTLQCQVRGGNPLATLTWQCKGSTMAGQDLTNDTTAVSSLTFTVDRTYHQQQCVCTAGHQASPDGQFGTASVGFTVIYPPTGKLNLTPSGVQSVLTGTPVTLQCQVRGGNPLATLTWQCKGSTMAGQDLTNDTTAVSSLTFTVDRTYHQQQCVCTAGHQASPDGQFGTVSVGFNVIYPPTGTLMITPSGTQTVLTGTPVTLKCQVRGGNPLATLTWQCKGSTMAGQDLTNDTTAVSSLTFTVDRTYHQQQCVCTAGHQTSPDGQFGTASVGFTVIYPPTGKLNLTPSGAQSVWKGSTVKLLCQVRGGNPLATLTWQCKGSTVVGQDLTNDTTAVSSLTFTVDRTYHQQQCVCTAGHQASPDGQFGTATVTFYVLYPPTVSTFAIDYTSPSYKGDNVNIDCMIEGGNPLATLSWTCVDQSKETYTNMDTTSRAMARLTITSITEIYNNKQCTCTVTHVGLSPSLTKSAVITVYYPPSIPTLSVDTTNGGALPWLDRPTFTGILTCTTTAGNPPTTRTTWYNNGVRNPGQSAMTRRFEPPDKDYNGHTFTCRADNDYTDTKKVVVESDGLMLDIEYDPIITLDQSPVYINESLVFSRICSADGNPSPTVSWYRDSTLVQSDGNLQFSTTDRQDAGTYTCTATARSTNGNLLLQSSNLLNIIVQYGPDVNLTISNTTENTTNFRLRCTANGVPNQYTYRWIHKFGSTVIRDTFDHVTSSGSVSTLTIPRVTYQDIGTYICEVDNGYKGRDGQLVQTRQGYLAVDGSPHVIEAEQRYVTEKGKPLDINITFISFPEPVNTTILRGSSALPPLSELSVNISSVTVTVPFYDKVLSVDGYMVALHFNDFETKHRGFYQLYVMNVIDFYYNFEIIISDKPDPPSGLDIGQITDSSAVITWTPGDDNGNPQTFTVTYQKSTGGPQTNVTLNRTILSYTLENLDVSTKYDVTIFASNAKGNSGEVTVTFSTKAVETSGVSAAVIGGTAGSAAAVILILCVVVVVVIIRRRITPSSQNHTEDESDDSSDGLKANVLYESAGPYFPEKPGPSNGNPSGDVYAVVDKPKSKPGVAETQMYAEVNKPKKMAPDSSLYAEVDKKKKGKAKNVKKTKTKVPGSSVYADVKKMKKGGKMAMKDEMVYENAGNNPDAADHGHANEETIYENAASPKENGSSRTKNADGLIYIDVEFKENGNKDRKFVIHGIENRTDYADVDFSKHADPLPEEDENENDSADPAV